jgi:hypothetical protein
MNAIASILLIAVNNDLLGYGEPTLAPPQIVEHTVSKPIISVVRSLRIDERSPITLAPDPDYPEHPGKAAFRERWQDQGRKAYREPTMAASAVAASSSAAAPAAPPVRAAPPPPKPAAVDRAVMVWSCQGGSCGWRPASSQPTQRVQTYQRRGLFRRLR